jgi:uncharacterized protein
LEPHMLLEFRVKNYRSIRDEQALSLIPVIGDTALLETNTHTTGSPLVVRVLSGCALYGANASGKSTLLNAMAFLQALVRDSATRIQSGQTLNVKGFAFDASTRNAPCSFELTVLVEGVRYQYGVALTHERIHEEWLLVYKSSKPQEWFNRSWNQATGEYDYGSFSASFLGPKELWKRSTRDNALFLSTAVQLNCEQLKPVWNWIVSSWLILPTQAGLSLDLSVQAIADVGSKQAMIEFLNAADIGIADIVIERQKVRQGAFQFDLATGNAITSEPVDTEILIPKFTHNGISGSAVFDLAEESQGTQRLFAFAGILQMILARGITLVVDEIENSLHPLLIRKIVELFFSPETNPNGAQIVFSTHNTILLDNEVLRRDQIWFADKGNDQATVLASLSDFSPRKTEAFAKGYLQGRYGAIPLLRPLPRQARTGDARK